MNIWAFEQAVLEREQVRIVIRAPGRTDVGEYEYARAAAISTSVTDWLAQRITPLIGDNEVVVIKGDGTVAHGRTRMDTLRNSYPE